MGNFITLAKPYFMSNPEWYYFDEKKWEYVLTEKATKRAKQSYKEYYKELSDNGS